MIRDFFEKIIAPWNKSTQFNETGHFSQAIILESDFQSYTEFGDNNERDQVEVLKKTIEDRLGKNIEVDGHEYGEGTFTIYLYCASADSTFAELESILRRSTFDRFEVTLQYGPLEDPNTQEKKFTFV